jgi:hypothetical protein
VSAGRAGRPRRRASVVGVCCGMAVIGCAPPPEPPRRAEAASSAGVGELSAGWGRIEATGQGLELDLPDADGWRHDGRDARSFVAVHAATRSRLLVRAWGADAAARPEDCERALRQLRPELPVLAPEQRVEERALRVAGDHAARLVAGVLPSPGSTSALAGHALLFASDGRRCLALVYSTSAKGEAAPRIIGERLAVMTRVTLEGVRRLDIDQRVQMPRR